MKTAFALAGFLCYAIPLLALYLTLDQSTPDPYKLTLPSISLPLASLGLTLGLIYIGTVFIRLSITT